MIVVAGICAHMPKVGKLYEAPVCPGMRNMSGRGDCHVLVVHALQQSSTHRVRSFMEKQSKRIVSILQTHRVSLNFVWIQGRQNMSVSVRYHLSRQTSYNTGAVACTIANPSATRRVVGKLSFGFGQEESLIVVRYV